MTIKLLLLKSGEEVISDVQEMVFGEDENRRVVGYYLTKPCIVKMHDPSTFSGDDKNELKKGFHVSLYPWMPLSSEEKIPVPSDWLVTMTEPIFKLKEMYIEDVINYGKDDQSNGVDEQSDSNQSD